jgi:cytochrome c oxidase subunit 2
LIAVPSFSLLYSIDEVLKPQITFKAIGHQWYWSYEFSDYVKFNGDEVTGQIAFDSNMLFESDLKMGELRLLNVDNTVILPTDVHVRILTTSFDVIHSWAVPSLGIKCDAVPGRLNQVFAKIQREGVFYGQCSELCGVNHGFMPIVIKAVSFDEYKNFISHQISNGS